MDNKLVIQEWDSMPVSAYKLVLAEVKENFNACISEVISVTDKTTNYTIGFLTFLFGISALVFVENDIDNYTWGVFILSALNVLNGVSIVCGRDGFSAGLISENILTLDFDDPDFSLDDKERLVYFNILKAYELKIEGIRVDNKQRAKRYNIFLVCTVILIFLIALNGVLAIS